MEAKNEVVIEFLSHTGLLLVIKHRARWQRATGRSEVEHDSSLPAG